MRYVWAGYGITLATLAAYAGWVVRRGRSLVRTGTGTGGRQEPRSGT